LQFLVAWKRENHRLLWGKLFFCGGGGGGKILVAENEEKTSSQKADREQFGA
jgi:hypothetical protein